MVGAWGVSWVGSGPNYAGFDGTHVWIGSSDGVATRITPAASSTTALPTPATVPTTATPAASPTPTTIPAYTHPSTPRNVQAGDLVQSGEVFSVELSWDPPVRSGSSAIESYEIRQAYYSETESWTVEGTELTTAAVSLSPARQYSFEVRAINQDGRKGPWSGKIYVATPSPPATTTTFQIVTTTTFQIVTTTTPAAARYMLYEHENTNVRWDPCSGPIRVKINPNSYVSATRLAEWEAHLTFVTSEISSISGLDIVYAGRTSTPLRNTHPGGRTSTDILFYVMPFVLGNFVILFFINR